MSDQPDEVQIVETSTTTTTRVLHRRSWRWAVMGVSYFTGLALMDFRTAITKQSYFGLVAGLILTAMALAWAKIAWDRWQDAKTIDLALQNPNKITEVHTRNGQTTIKVRSRWPNA